VIGIDGLGADDLSEPSLAPVLSRLARRGALSTLRTLHPNEGPPLWTTLMTGRYPRDHGVLSATTYELAGSKSVWHLLPKGAGIGLVERAGLARRLPVSSSARTRRAIWNVLDAFGMPTGIVRVWGTQPPEAIQGFVVSPYFHLLSQDPARAGSALHARDLLKEVTARMVKAEDLDPALLAGFAEGAHGGAPLDDPRLRSLAESALAPDLSYQRAAQVLSATYRPALLVLSFNGYDAVGHSFYREAHPEDFGDVRPEDARRYGRVLERYASLLGGYVTDWQKDARTVRHPGGGLGARSRADAALAPAAGRAERHAGRVVVARGGSGGPAGGGRRRDPALRADGRLLGAGRRADAALFARAAGGARHGRPRADGDPRAVVRARAPGDVHPELRGPGGGARRPGHAARRAAAAAGRVIACRLPCRA
jgi:hypothetical protein